MYRIISLIRLPLKPFFSHPNCSPISSLFHSSPLLSSRQRKDADAEHNDVSLINRDPDTPPKLLVVQPRVRPDSLLKVKLSEALNLANSLEEQRDGYFDSELCDKEMPPHVIVQNPSARSNSVRADRYFGAGTVDTIKCHLNAVESQGGVDAVFVNTILSGIQQRNLEGAWGLPVLDRVGLIIEIFNAHAYTREAKLQAELAALMYQKTRLVRSRGPDGRNTFGASGESEVVSARGRGSGGRGFMGGAGETELQLQRRRIFERRSRLLAQIEDVRRTRALQRASRKRHGGSHGEALATVAIVGYTNAGKSTLVSALSDTDLFSDDRMFATVDPRLRSVVLPSGKKVLLSDTVGFISDLPIQLVEAFHATLEEVVEADLLVHVLDSSAPDLDEQRSTVLQVLEQIGVSEEKFNNMIEVWNKIDLQNEEMHADEYLEDEADSFTKEDDDDVESELSEGAEDEACSLLGEEDDDEASELLCGNPNGSYDDDDDDDDNKDDIDSELLMDLEETIDGQQGNKSKGWCTTGDGQVPDDDQDVPSNGWETLNDQQRDCLKDCRIIGKGSHSQTQHVPHVKTSGVMGVGLQELLVLIDERLKTPKVINKGSFDRKWRPPPTDDAGIAVEQ